MACDCRCHLPSIPSGILVAPESRDAVDAATACSRCVNAHCAVLLIRRAWCALPEPVEPPPPAIFTADPEE